MIIYWYYFIVKLNYRIRLHVQPKTKKCKQLGKSNETDDFVVTSHASSQIGGASKKLG